MQHEDQLFAERLRNAWPETGAPDFDATWMAAGERRRQRRWRNRGFVAAAAITAALAVAFLRQAPGDESYVEMAELLGSTYWSAPSDVLLPDREFDIYQDMPVIFESTEPAGGTLL